MVQTDKEILAQLPADVAQRLRNIMRSESPDPKDNDYDEAPEGIGDVGDDSWVQCFDTDSTWVRATTHDYALVALADSGIWHWSLECKQDYEDDAIGESSLFIDPDQGGTTAGVRFGFIGTNDTDEYQGWFFRWPEGAETIQYFLNTPEDDEAIVASLEADEASEGMPQIPYDWAEDKLREYLEQRRERMGG